MAVTESSFIFASGGAPECAGVRVRALMAATAKLRLLAAVTVGLCGSVIALRDPPTKVLPGGVGDGSIESFIYLK